MKKTIGIIFLSSALVISGSLIVLGQETTDTTATTVVSEQTNDTRPALPDRIKNLLQNFLGNKPPKPVANPNGNNTKPSIPQNLRNNTSTKPMINKSKTTLDTACVKAAIAKRDSAIASAWNTRSTKLNEAFSQRSTALQTAWNKTTKTEKQTALKTAWDAFKLADKTLTKDFITAKNTAWKTYKEEMKQCGSEAIVQDVTTTDIEQMPTQ